MNYCELTSRLFFRNATVKKIGQSVLNKPIFGVFFDFGAREWFIISASIHARENITANLALLLAKQLDFKFSELKKHNKLPNIVIVPMVNPDGVEICFNGTTKLSFVQAKRVKEFNFGQPFNLYKANVRGVDLNNNFNAWFNTDPALKKFPASSGFAGPFFESEPESRALARLARELNTVFTISLHSKGEEIYYDFHLPKKEKEKHKKVAKIFAKVLKYKLVDSFTKSCGGFKDYCVLKLKKPSITIEIGSDELSHPITERSLQKIAKRFSGFIFALEKAYGEILKLKLNK